jgi:hypothetical protein
LYCSFYTFFEEIYSNSEKNVNPTSIPLENIQMVTTITVLGQFIAENLSTLKGVKLPQESQLIGIVSNAQQR